MDIYRSGFFIREAVSNNAFSYEKRSAPELFVAPLMDGGFADVEGGERIVFEDFNERGELVSCRGLQNFVKTHLNGIPVYIFDNHNHAFAFWHLEALSGTVGQGALLVHIDQHKDSREPESYLTADQAQNPAVIINYTNKVLNVGNFIPAAVKTGMAGTVVNITSEKEMDSFVSPSADSVTGSTPPPGLILDIDLDFFAPEMDYIDNQKKISFIKKIIPQAKLITVATSPFFIKQERAIKYLRKIFS